MKYSRKTSREVTSPTALSNVKMKMSRRLQPGTLSVNSARAITLNPAKELNRHPTVIRVRDKLSNEPWFPEEPIRSKEQGRDIRDQRAGCDESSNHHEQVKEPTEATRNHALCQRPCGRRNLGRSSRTLGAHNTNYCRRSDGVSHLDSLN